MNWQQWQNLRIGYGLEPIPVDLRGQLQCAMCTETRHLYTTEPVKVKEATTRAYQKLHENLIGKCFCRTHAIYMYGEESSHAG